jgi:hypothetical protein
VEDVLAATGQMPYHAPKVLLKQDGSKVGLESVLIFHSQQRTGAKKLVTQL